MRPLGRAVPVLLLAQLRPKQIIARTQKYLHISNDRFGNQTRFITEQHITNRIPSSSELNLCFDFDLFRSKMIFPILFNCLATPGCIASVLLMQTFVFSHNAVRSVLLFTWSKTFCREEITKRRDFNLSSPSFLARKTERGGRRGKRNYNLLYKIPQPFFSRLSYPRKSIWL